MGKYVVDTDELRAIAKELDTKSGELSDIVGRINAQVAIGRDQQSPRIKRNIDQIEPIAKNIQSTIEDIGSGVSTIRTSAKDIDDANQ